MTRFCDGRREELTEVWCDVEPAGWRGEAGTELRSGAIGWLEERRRSSSLGGVYVAQDEDE